MPETIRTGTETNTKSWKQLLEPATHRDLLTLSARDRARQAVTDSPEERTRRLLEDIERGIQRRLDEWCGERTQDIRRTRKNILRALRRRMEKDTGPRQYTYEEIRRQIQARTQRTLDNVPRITYPRPRIYAPRRKRPRCLPQPSPRIPDLRRKAYHGYPTYLGSMEDLFTFYDLERWDNHPDVEGSYQNPGQARYPFSSLLKAQIMMCKRRIPTYTELQTQIRDDPELREICGLGSVPSRKLLSRCVDLFGTQIYTEIYRDLAQRCLGLGLARGRVVGLDGTLIRSGISPYRKREDYQRVGADIFARKGFAMGVGHLLLDVVDLELGQPLYSHLEMGSRHEGPLGLVVIDGYHNWHGCYPEAVVVDKAYDSEEFVEGLVERGVEPYVQARDYGQDGLIRLGQYWNLRTRYLSDIQIHPGFLARIISLRTESERNFSRAKHGYGRRRMTNQGRREAVLYTTITNIASLLTAVCAYHCSRPDLVCSPTAFSRPITARN